MSARLHLVGAHLDRGVNEVPVDDGSVRAEVVSGAALRDADAHVSCDAVRGPAWSVGPDKTGVMTSLSPAAVDEVTTLAQRLEEVMHELREGAKEDQVGGLVAHADRGRGPPARALACSRAGLRRKEAGPPATAGSMRAETLDEPRVLTVVRRPTRPGSALGDVGCRVRVSTCRPRTSLRSALRSGSARRGA